METQPLDIMVRFEKTRIHPASAALILVGLYASAGLAYAGLVRSADSAAIWAIVAILSFIAAAAYQRYVSRKRRRMQ